jgi:hypothetical protein
MFAQAAVNRLALCSIKTVSRVVSNARIRVENLGLYLYYRSVAKHLNQISLLEQQRQPPIRKLTRDEMFSGATDFERMTGVKFPENIMFSGGYGSIQVPITKYVTGIFDSKGKRIDTHLSMRLHTWN